MIKLTNRVNKFILMTLCIFLLFNCAENRFKNNFDLHVFTFGLAGYNDFKYCNKMNPEFINPYKNGVNPSKICIRYQYYTCHKTYYCPNFATEEERKKCEKDAAQYWTPQWDNAKGNLEKRVEISNKVCKSEAEKNNIINHQQGGMKKTARQVD